ncbi:MAG TPA: hypothetical protein VF162_16020 [Streptosporangiaceae bacterium]
MSKRATLISAVVVAAIVAAILGATAALRLIGGGAIAAGGRPLSESDVRKAFNAARHTPTARQSPAGPSQSSSPQPSGTAGESSGAFTSAGGSVFAACRSGKATLGRWIPANGYAIDGYVQGPARSAWVKFKADGSEITVTVTCVSGQPHFVASADDSGGGHGGGGGGR